MRNIEGVPGVNVGGRIVNNLRYANDTVLIAKSQEDLQKLLNIVVSESEMLGLTLNEKRTETMSTSRRTAP